MSLPARELLGLLDWNEGLHQDDWTLRPPPYWIELHGRFAAVREMREANRAFARGRRP